MDILRPVAGTASKASIAQKEAIQEAPLHEGQQEARGLDQLQKEALSEVENQLADLQRRQARKKSREDDNTAERPRHASKNSRAGCTQSLMYLRMSASENGLGRNVLYHSNAIDFAHSIAPSNLRQCLLDSRVCSLQSKVEAEAGLERVCSWQSTVSIHS